MAEIPADTIEYDGVEFRRICGYAMRGNWLDFPCFLEPDHDGEHLMAAFHARYLQDGETGAMYMREGR